VNMPAKLKKVGYGFWFRWVLATMIGFVVSLHWVEIGTRPELGSLEGAVGGAIVGLIQCLVLRQRIAYFWIWGIVCIAGWSLLGFLGIGALGWVAPRDMFDIFLRAVWGLIEGMKIGFVIGGLQWLVLRWQVPHGWRWIIASMLGWAIGLGAGWTVGAILRSRTGLFLGEVVGLSVTWGVMAAVTGVCLVELLQQDDRKTLFRLK
jgi:hypothetical protein